MNIYKSNLYTYRITSENGYLFDKEKLNNGIFDKEEKETLRFIFTSKEDNNLCFGFWFTSSLDYTNQDLEDVIKNACVKRNN